MIHNTTDTTNAFKATCVISNELFLNCNNNNINNNTKNFAQEENNNNNINGNKISLFSTIVDKLGITLERFPNTSILYHILSSVFIISFENSTQNLQPEYKKYTEDISSQNKNLNHGIETEHQSIESFCSEALHIFGELFVEYKMFLMERSPPWNEAWPRFYKTLYSRSLKYYRLNNTENKEKYSPILLEPKQTNENQERDEYFNSIEINPSYIIYIHPRIQVNLQQLWRTLCEELWWRIFGWESWNNFAFLKQHENKNHYNNNSNNNNNNNNNNYDKSKFLNNNNTNNININNNNNCLNSLNSNTHDNDSLLNSNNNNSNKLNNPNEMRKEQNEKSKYGSLITVDELIDILSVTSLDLNQEDNENDNITEIENNNLILNYEQELKQNNILGHVDRRYTAFIYQLLKFASNNTVDVIRMIEGMEIPQDKELSKILLKKMVKKCTKINKREHNKEKGIHRKIKKSKNQNKFISNNNNNNNNNNSLGYEMMIDPESRSLLNLSKPGHEFNRFFQWGYYFATLSEFQESIDFSLICPSQNDKIDSKLDMNYSTLYNSDSSISSNDNKINNYKFAQNVVLIDLDNVGRSIEILGKRQFAWPNTAFYAFHGPDLVLNSFARKWAFKYQKLYLFKVNPGKVDHQQSEDDKLMNNNNTQMKSNIEPTTLEKYMFHFYETGYLRRYKNAADYALSAFCGVLHRLLPLSSRFWIISKDDGLMHPIRNLRMKGRYARQISEEELVHTLDYNLLSIEPEFTERDGLTHIKDETHKSLSELNSISKENNTSTSPSLSTIEPIKPINSKTKNIKTSTSKNYKLSKDALKQMSSESFYSHDEIESKLMMTVNQFPFDRDLYEQEMGEYLGNILVQDAALDKPKIRRLITKGRRFGVQGLKPLIHSGFIAHHHLTHLCMRSNRITDDGMVLLSSVLPSMSHLVFLDLAAALCGDRGAQSFATYLKDPSCSVKLVDLRWNRIGYIGSQYLASALESNQNLTVLNLRRNVFNAEGAQLLIQAAEKHPNLVTLDIRETSTRDVGTHLEQRLGSLTTLDISGNRVKSIETLAASLKEHCDDGLVRLSADFNQFGDHGVRLLAHSLWVNRSLVVLTLAHNSIGNDGVSALATSLRVNNTLTALDLQRNNISDKGACHLADAMCQNSTLTSLILNKNKIGCQGAMALAKMLMYHYNNKNRTPNENNYGSSLIKLELRENYIQDRGASYLAQALKFSPYIESLNLRGNQIGDNGLCELANNISHCTHFRVLDIESCNIRHYGCTALSSSINQHPRFELLNMAKNKIGDDSIDKSIAQLGSWLPSMNNASLNTVTQLSNALLSDNHNLTYMNLSHNNLGDSGVSVLSQYLASNSFQYGHCIAKLDISFNNITESGTKALGDMLKTNQTLVMIHLKGNPLHDDGIRELCQGLYCNNTLTMLQLESTGIGSEGAKYLGQMLDSTTLESCPSNSFSSSQSLLFQLDLAGNSIDDQGAQWLAQGLASSNALSVVNLERNPLRERYGANAICKSMETRLATPIDGTTTTVETSQIYL